MMQYHEHQRKLHGALAIHHMKRETNVLKNEMYGVIYSCRGGVKYVLSYARELYYVANQ